MPTVHLLDYVAGNVRSLANAIEKLGYQIEWIKEPKEIQNAEVGGVVDRIQTFIAQSAETSITSQGADNR